MKKFILIVGALLLVGCGPSQQEKERVAQVACSEIMATRNFEEARRISILNDALLELGRDPYYSSSLFETQLVLGGTRACKDIINPPPPPTKAELKAQKEAQKEAKKAAEERRKKKEEEERIAAAEAEREAEERKKYVLENQVTTHLYCEPLTERQLGVGEKQRDGHSEIDYLLFKLNKLEGDYIEKDHKLDGDYIESEVQIMYKEVQDGGKHCNLHKRIYQDNLGQASPCKSTSRDKLSPSGDTYFSGLLKQNEDPDNHGCPYRDRSLCDDLPTPVASTDENSSFFGHEYFNFGSISVNVGNVRIIDNDFLIRLDRVTLKTFYDPSAQCEIVTKEEYLIKVQEKEDLLNDYLESIKKEKVSKQKQKQKNKI